ncbi:hypothetical protein BGZ83_002977, partial [Gryganskiella cystojenkinii]
MWSITFFTVAPAALCVMIMNAAEPVIDYSYLHKPTATVSTVHPPLAAPAPRHASSPHVSTINSNNNHVLGHLRPNAKSSWIPSPIKYVTRSTAQLLRRSWSSSSSRRIKTASSTAALQDIIHDEISGMDDKQQYKQEQKPFRSRYSPPAAPYYVDEEALRQYQHHASNYN